MDEHIELLEKEIRSAERNLESAKKRPGVTEAEIANLERKIRIKSDLLIMVRRSIE